MNFKDYSIYIIGLGYVGLPLAVEFGKIYETFGFDIDVNRIVELQNGYDRTGEVTDQELAKLTRLTFQKELCINKVKNSIFIITVPTPIDSFKNPDLRPLISASKLIGKCLQKGDLVIYESTVYPGCTEDDLVPELEVASGLKFNKDFFCGYSPERINPGDKINTLTKIKKITSGSTPDIANFVNKLYLSVIEAGTFQAASIKVAEAAKLVENCQRDVNISFVNELALIFDKVGIDTMEVLEAARSKWNFLNFKPGLVGGQCIGVDPYYMIHKAESLGYYPELIGAGRKINDQMGVFVANKVIKLMISKGIAVKGAKALILGITFKENCSDIRNTRVIDIYNEFKEFGLAVDIYDPLTNKFEVNDIYGISLINKIETTYDTIVLAVGHNEILELNIKAYAKKDSVLYNLTGFKSDLNFDGKL